MAGITKILDSKNQDLEISRLWNEHVVNKIKEIRNNKDLNMKNNQEWNAYNKKVKKEEKNELIFVLLFVFVISVVTLFCFENDFFIHLNFNQHIENKNILDVSSAFIFSLSSLFKIFLGMLIIVSISMCILIPIITILKNFNMIAVDFEKEKEENQDKIREKIFNKDKINFTSTKIFKYINDIINVFKKEKDLLNYIENKIILKSFNDKKYILKIINNIKEGKEISLLEKMFFCSTLNEVEFDEKAKIIILCFLENK